MGWVQGGGGCGEGGLFCYELGGGCVLLCCILGILLRAELESFCSCGFVIDYCLVRFLALYHGLWY